ncbi:hypothetical protein CKM354_000790700 [Cercospora kikuchii]|uniref:Uncharacterized protein n=1 Tax=Cercospora kikuchii TaxID=84275 RepID=A0A9P3FES5_9PEZI|nr:uncharacterized protein CKM354_000790700 [Cercospora kikuchii]GIZ44716.1 hypothetical protein CKM354_000790700 [Cercospora kikuchii]
MQILATIASIALLFDQGLAAPEPQTPAGYGYGKKPSCPADQCFSKIRLNRPAAKIASSVCSKYIKYTATVTKTTTSSSTTTITTTTKVDETPTPPTVTSTSTVTSTPPAVTESPICATTTSTVPGTFTTSVDYIVRGAEPGLKKRAVPMVNVPSVLGAGCGSGKPFTSKISSACSCLLGTTKTKTSTATSTVSVTTTVTSTNTLAPGTTTTTTTVTDPTPTSTDCQTTTVTTTTFAGGPRTCGVPVSTYTTAASVTCSNVAPPGETNGYFRIEGGSEGNIFDGCIVAGPRNITTPSGGTHLCDGTNNNANPAPGGTLTTQIDAAGRQEGFGYDGSYSTTFQDFFITSISATTQTGNQFWGVLRNRVFTSRGGCQEQSFNGDEGLWAFDAFAPNRVFLSLSPAVAVVRPGETITVTILAGNPNNGATIPASGATLGTGSPAGADGSVQLTAPTAPGCYLYKAERTNAIRSNALYLTVADDL